MRGIADAFRAAAILVLTVTGATGCRVAASSERPLTPVRTSEAKWATTGVSNTYSANIQPYAQVDLAFKSSGYIVGLRQVKGSDGRMRNVGEGDYVRQGTVLATVQEDEFKEKLSQAQAQLARAQADYNRTKLSFDRTSALYGAGAATKPDYDNATAQLDTAKASLQSGQASVTEAGIALGYCQLRAPFDSWVLKRSVDIGSLVGPATNGFSVADTRYVKAVFGVPDTVMSRIRLGSPETISAQALPDSFHGRVSAVSPTADPKSRVYSVEVTIPNPRNQLKSGMIASITIGSSEPEKRMLVVPLSAVVRSPGDANGFAVFITNGSDKPATVRAQNVSVGDAYGNMIAIVSGLRPGDRVVTSGATMIRSGEQVRVIP
jgi:multidrug efflux system membrane fusion protein